MAVKSEVIPGLYRDSVVLMRISAQVRERAAVREVALFMGTPANQALLKQAGLATDEARTAGPNDLIITAVAAAEAQAVSAIADVKALLAGERAAREGASDLRPHSLDAALRALPDANVAALSVPGAYVRSEALAALRRNLHLFIFSDNVPLEDEVALKDEALRRRRFCMGPDQGTAYLGGIGLGFANRITRGRVGIVAASGTGLQAVACRLDALGEGVSNAIGVGGRDLSEAVAGRMTLFALEALDSDPATEAIVLVSKPPHPSVLGPLQARLRGLRKPAVVCCIGAEPRSADSIPWVETLDQAADAAAARLAGRRFQPQPFTDPDGIARHLAHLGDASRFRGQRILGLYTGGTLAYETTHLLERALGTGHPHRILDLGDDAYTIGRPHPMIDPRSRCEQVAAAGDDPEVAVVLLDLVLGTGSHENPAGPLAAAVQAAQRAATARGKPLVFLAAIVGTRRDAQDLPRQAELLERAGVRVLSSNADCARLAAMLVRPALAQRWLAKEP